MKYHRTWQSALLALANHGYLWTNPIEADDHTTQAIGRELVERGFAVFIHVGKGGQYGKLALTDNGLVEGLMLRMNPS